MLMKPHGLLNVFALLLACSFTSCSHPDLSRVGEELTERQRWANCGVPLDTPDHEPTWEHQYVPGHTSPSRLRDVAVDQHGNVLVGVGPVNDQPALLDQYAVDGKLSWSVPIDTSWSPHRLAIRPSGDILVLGVTRKDADESLRDVILRYDGDGNELAPVELPIYDNYVNAYALAVGPDSSIAVYGTSSEFEPRVLGRSVEHWIAVLDQSGSLRWRLVVAAGEPRLLDHFWALVVDSAGNVIAAGQEWRTDPNGFEIRSALVAKYTATGAELWRAQFDSTAPTPNAAGTEWPFDAYAEAAVVDHDDNIIVVGSEGNAFSSCCSG
jgi:hypothetical protein